MKVELNFVKANVPLPNDCTEHFAVYARSSCKGDTISIMPSVLCCVYDPVFGKNRFNTCLTDIGKKNEFELEVEYYALIDGVFEVPFKKCYLLDKTDEFL